MPKIKIIAAVLVMAFLLTSCSSGINDLMSPPKLPDNFQRVKDVLDADVASGYHLIYTLRGTDTSAVRFVDLTGDGMKESLAFYKQNGATDEISVHVMTQEFGNWQTLYDFSMKGIDIDKVSFCDFKGDNKLELVIGRRTTDAGGNILSIYSFDGKVKEEYTSEYLDFMTADVDGKGRTELFDIAPTQDKKSIEGRIVGNDEGYRMLGSVKMDSGVTSYSSIKTGYYAPGKIGIFIDGLKGATTGETELLIYESGTLKNPLSAASNALNISAKQFSIISRDIDADGIIEIATVERFPGNEQTPMPDAVWNIKWNAYTADGKLMTKDTMMFNPYYNFAVTLPQKLSGLVAAEMSGNGTHMNIYPVGDKSAVLCTIISGHRVDISTMENEVQEIFSKDDAVIAVKKGTANAKYSALALTDDEIAAMKVQYNLSESASRLNMLGEG